MPDFYQAVGALLSDEGEAFVPEDNGRGASKWGITLATYQEIHPDATAADIEALTRDDAVAFYREWAWERRHLGRINDQALATKMLDLGPNIGMETAIMLLQKAVGVAADGIIGDRTAAAVNAKPGLIVLNDLRAAGKAHYDAILASNPDKYASQYPGWIARLNK